jgi:formate hydrogenlyase subunit 6/NADH:ubiquinone oxidoreductase subunit I
MQKQNTYWSNIGSAIKTLYAGLITTLRHIRASTKSNKPIGIQNENYFTNQHGIATLQYPHQFLPVPDTGRYRLHNEIDDCIVCDKCAKICPVNCITIEPIKALEEIGRTSDGTPKRIYAARFDIDMGKCCFCGLCTTVCPTECLTMTKVYDFSVFDIREHNYAFADMSEQEIISKRQQLENARQSKPSAPVSGEIKAKPVFKPKIKPPGSSI